MESKTKEAAQVLLDNIKARLQELEHCLKEVTSHWNYEDLVYRFYHQSFKVYHLQGATKKIVDLLLLLSPSGNFTRFFNEIIESGTSKIFDFSHNEQWTEHTRPIVEAFFHAKYFLEMAVKYGHELAKVPEVLPSGWASLLCLYDIR